jgi:hypothetical protein
VILLMINWALSLVLTIVTIVARHSIVDYQLDHRHITDPSRRAALRDSYIGAIIGRVIGNIVASVVYVFLVQALVLAALVFVVTRPAVRAYFASHLRGRNIRCFRS